MTMMMTMKKMTRKMRTVSSQQIEFIRFFSESEPIIMSMKEANLAMTLISSPLPEFEWFYV